MSNGIIQTLSYNFAKDLVIIYSQIIKEEKEYVLSKQLLRSGTSIAANIVEAQTAGSRKEFIYKLSLSLREAKETLFWLQLINDTEIYSKIKLDNLETDCGKIVGILVRIIKKTKVTSN
jgi:four helix bundle protein